MNEVDPGNAAAPIPRAGTVLREAREAKGLTLAEVGTRTRIPQRHLEAIERSDYASLPSTTYATGFAKAYARAVGADEVAIAQEVRGEVLRMGRRQPEYQPYEIADQNRVPSRGVAVVGLGIALAVLVLVGLWYGTDLFRRSGGTDAGATGASIAGVTSATPSLQNAATTRPIAVPTATSVGGQVTLAANDEVWLRVYDADDKTLYVGTMKPGERFDVPGAARDPKINVGRPDKLAVTLNGSAIPPLGDGSRPIKDVKVSAAAIAARLSGVSAAPAPAANPRAPGTPDR